MGRKSKLSDAQWEKLSTMDWHGIANSLLRISNNEAAVVQVLRLMLLFGDLANALGVAPVTRYRFEVAVATGRIDLLLCHGDGGVSIVETKAERLPREIALGIGQLFMYEAAIQKTMRPAYVNRILVAPIKAEESVALYRACELAGVRFVPFPAFDVMKHEIGRLRALSPAHG